MYNIIVFQVCVWPGYSKIRATRQHLELGAVQSDQTLNKLPQTLRFVINGLENLGLS